MKNLTLALLCLFSLAQCCVVYPQSEKRGNPESGQAAGALTPRVIADKALRSVVLIVTTDENGKPVGQGSGFIFRPGLVVTNLHVLTRGTNALVRNVASGKTHTAVEIVGMNAKSDLCVIRIADRSIPYLPLAPSAGTEVGDEVYVASNPEGLEGSITKGIVSSVRIDAGLVQIDAPISAGSSGGAVINRRGEVVGIVKSSLTEGQNLNFAIPVERLRSLPLNLALPVIAAGACAYRDKDRDRLRGLVRSVTEKEESFWDVGGVSAKLLVPSIKVYDIDGNMVEYHVYGVKPDGGKFKVSLAFKQVSSIDENRLQTAVTRITSSGSKETTRFTFEEAVDLKIRIRQFSRVDRSGDANLGTRIYDSEGNMTEWLIKGARNVYTYERDGRMKEHYDGNGTRGRYLYEDDDHGNWIVRREEAFYEGAWMPVEGVTVYREITYFQ